MYQKMKKILARLLPVLLLSCMAMVSSAQGASCTVDIPVEVQTSGTGLPADVEYSVVLEAVTDGAPVPAATTVSLTGGKAKFGPITYTVPADYQYRVYQNSKTQEYLTFDSAAYTVTVRVVNDDKGGLAAEVWAVREGSTDKAESVLFTNVYDPPEETESETETESEEESETETEKQTEAAKKDSTPKTGDDTNLTLWGSLLGVSALAVLILLWQKRRRTSEQ